MRNRTKYIWSHRLLKWSSGRTVRLSRNDRLHLSRADCSPGEIQDIKSQKWGESTTQFCKQKIPNSCLIVISGPVNQYSDCQMWDNRSKMVCKFCAFFRSIHPDPFARLESNRVCRSNVFQSKICKQIENTVFYGKNLLPHVTINQQKNHRRIQLCIVRWYLKRFGRLYPHGEQTLYFPKRAIL
jgi:hypothetical protein